MNRFSRWFSTSRRQSVQLIFGTLAPLAVALGLGTGEEWSQYLILSAAGLQFVGALTNLVNLKVGDLPLGFAVVRGAIYTLAATVAPPLVSLNVLAPYLADRGLTVISLGLSALSSIVAVMTSQRQVEDAEKRDLEKTYAPS